jgi:hypothetical protein
MNTVIVRFFAWFFMLVCAHGVEPLTQEQLEEKLVATLSQSTFTGRWCLIEKGVMGEEKQDKYTILSISKVTGGKSWFITARIQYGERDLTIPVPVEVRWAGDTPIIVVDKLGVPGGGTYSARLMIFEDTYAGTWSGGDHAGLMSGVITREKKTP